MCIAIKSITSFWFNGGSFSFHCEPLIRQTDCTSILVWVARVCERVFDLTVEPSREFTARDWDESSLSKQAHFFFFLSAIRKKVVVAENVLLSSNGQGKAFVRCMRLMIETNFILFSSSSSFQNSIFKLMKCLRVRCAHVCMRVNVLCTCVRRINCRWSYFNVCNSVNRRWTIWTINVNKKRAKKKKMKFKIKCRSQWTALFTGGVRLHFLDNLFLLLFFLFTATIFQFNHCC